MINTKPINRRKANVYITAILVICFAVVALLAGTDIARAEDDFVDGQATYKVGMQIKVVDKDGNGVENVTFIANYDGQDIAIGPSDANGVAKSEPDAFQLYYKNKFYENMSHVLNKHVLKMPLAISVASWPAEYKKPTFQIPDYTEADGHQSSFNNVMAWSFLGHGDEAEKTYMDLGIDIWTEHWDGKIDGITDITFAKGWINPFAYPLFGEQREGYIVSESPNPIPQYSDGTEIKDGDYFNSMAYYTYDYKNMFHLAYGPIAFTETEKPEYDIEVSKVEIGGSEEIEGAELQITRTTNPEQEIFEPITWTSGKETKKIKLVPGDYVLTELEAPKNYKKAESIAFTVTEDGKVTVGGEEQTGNKIIMEDARKAPRLSVKKTSDVKEAKTGDVIPFVITATNSGEGDAEKVELMDTMGDDLEYVSDDTNGAVDGQTVTWTVDIPAGQSKTINIRCRIKESAVGKVINSVVITNYESEFIEPSGEDDAFEIVLTEEEEPVVINDEKPESDTPTAGPDEGSKKAEKDSARTGDEIGLATLFLLLIASGLAAIHTRRSREF